MALRAGAARRYAQAVFDIAVETDSLDRWQSDLGLLAGIFGDSNVLAVLEDPKLSEPDQERLISEHLAKGVIDPLPLNLVRLLVKRGRLGLLPRIVEIYGELYNRAKGIVVAEVVTAIPLDDAHRKLVTSKLADITGGKTIDLRVREDPAILGGIVVKIGDQLLDASVATRLETLQARMS